MIAIGVRTSFGLFLHPVSHDLNLGRGIFAFAIALQNLIWGMAQPFAGALADRYGTGRVVATGGVIYALGFVVMSQATDLYSLTLGAGFIVGVALAATGFPVVLAAIGRAFPDDRRPWALGIATAAGSVGQFVWVPLGQLFLETGGWPTAFILLGVASFVIAPLAAALAGRGPGSTLVPVESLGQALGEARRHRGYLYLNAGFFVCGFHVAFVATHLPAYLTDAGFSGRLGAWALALVGLFNIVGSYTAGVLGGRHSKKYLLSMLYFSRAIVIALFVILPLSAWTAFAFAAALGLLWLSTVPLTSSLVAQIFGPRYLATLFGIVFLSHQIGAFLGIWWGGLVFDQTGSYTVVWWVSVALGLMSALVHWPIDERPLRRPAHA
ncbi:MAG: MFS transporter [Alphaproteobacteria bacterium]